METEQTIDLGYCLCGRVAQSGSMVTSLNCFTDKRHETQFEGMTLHGHINLPLKVGNRVLGVLFLYLPGNLKPTKDQINLLESVANQLSIALENARLYEKVHHLSVHDPLTNLFNRKMLFDRLDEEVSRSERSGKPLSIAMIDIDHFKIINDNYGHMAGDRILSELSRLLKGNVRNIDTVARFGGEEFMILLPDSDLEKSITSMERLRVCVEKHAFPTDKDGQTISLTISIGISVFDPGNPVDKPDLVKASDEALYKAKETGRNRVCHSNSA
jgi:diguanylate cyclase (GGDEF)-like protein